MFLTRENLAQPAQFCHVMLVWQHTHLCCYATVCVLDIGMVNCVKNECYDPVSDRWEALEDTPAEFGHIHRSVAIIDDVAYLLGTYEGKEANTHYYYFKG